jgi:hypothetical protein
VITNAGKKEEAPSKLRPATRGGRKVARLVGLRSEEAKRRETVRGEAGRRPAVRSGDCGQGELPGSALACDKRSSLLRVVGPNRASSPRPSQGSFLFVDQDALVGYRA